MAIFKYYLIIYKLFRNKFAFFCVYMSFFLRWKNRYRLSVAVMVFNQSVTQNEVALGTNPLGWRKIAIVFSPITGKPRNAGKRARKSLKVLKNIVLFLCLLWLLSSRIVQWQLHCFKSCHAQLLSWKELNFLD